MNKRQKFLHFAPPSIGEEEIAEVVDTLKSGWITTGPKVQRFEEEFSAFVGTSSLALSSATAGLQIALTALGIGKGDLVISTPMTFCSGITAIEDVGATPILVDICSDTLNIDPEKIKEVLETHPDRKKIKAIIPVHYAGHPCDMESILNLVKKYDLKVIEDAAHAIPAKYQGKRIGSIGDLTAFSFYVTKNMTTAEGGMLTGQNTEALKKARVLSLHGISHDAWKRYEKEGSWYYEVIERGFKANMTDIQAAIGIHQLKKLADFHKRRQEIANQYTNAFTKIDELETPTQRFDVEHAWHLYTLRLNLNQLKVDRSKFIEELKKRNIGSSVHFIPAQKHPYFKKKFGWEEKNFPVTSKEFYRIISLPIYPKMLESDVQSVIEAVSDIAKTYRK